MGLFQIPVLEGVHVRPHECGDVHIFGTLGRARSALAAETQSHLDVAIVQEFLFIRREG